MTGAVIWSRSQCLQSRYKVHSRDLYSLVKAKNKVTSAKTCESAAAEM